MLARDCGLGANSTIADVGSGTGLLARLFLDLGCRVIGVEPNAAMRQGGEAFLSRYDKFESVDGRAECTGLRDASVDLVTVGQAFHWFDRDAARREFARILNPPRWCALAWNERQVAGAFLEGYEDLLMRYATEYPKVDHRRLGPAEIARFFGPGTCQHAKFPNVQSFDLDGVRGRLHSSSYAPRAGEPGYEPMMAGIDRLFREHAVNGRVDFVYETHLYYGTL